MSVVKKSLSVLSVLFSVLMISFLGKQAIVNWQRNRLIPEPDGYAVLQEESTPRSELGEKDWIAADRKLFVLLEGTIRTVGFYTQFGLHTGRTEKRRSDIGTDS